MKTIVYYKLNKYDNSHSCFPFVIAGYFNDGIQQFPIWLQEQGEILFEFFTLGKIDIGNVDQEFLKHTGMKKIPNDVVCYIDLTPI